MSAREVPIGIHMMMKIFPAPVMFMNTCQIFDEPKTKDSLERTWRLRLPKNGVSVGQQGRYDSLMSKEPKILGMIACSILSS